MRYVAIIISFLLFPLYMSGNVHIDSLRQVVAQLEEGLKTKETTKINHCLADEFSIHAYSLPSARNLLNTILSSVNFASVRLESEKTTKEGGCTYVDAVFTLESGKKERSVVAFDSHCRILFIDYFDRLFGGSRFNEASLVATIPFRVENHSIVLSIKLNDSPKSYSFILDTGATGMAVRKSAAEEAGLKMTGNQQAYVVGGQSVVQFSGGNVIHLSEQLSLKNQSLAVFDEVRNADGLIGLGLMKQYITKVDFDTHTISLYRFGDYRFPKKGYIIPVSLPHGSLVLPAELDLLGKNPVPSKFVMDTGANYNLIAFSRYVRKNRLLLSGFKPDSTGTTVSLGHVTPVFHGKAHMLKVGDVKKKNTVVTLQASAGQDRSADTGVDGSVGIRFFEEYNFTVDLLRKKIHLSPRTNK